MNAHRRIAVVDDDPASLELMSEILHLEGYEVVPLVSVSPDLNELLVCDADLIVVDLRLATAEYELSGWDVVRLVKAHRSMGATPVIVVSADLPALRALIPATLQHSGVTLLAKPFALDSLSVMVRLALQAPQLIPYLPPLDEDVTRLTS